MPIPMYSCWIFVLYPGGPCSAFVLLAAGGFPYLGLYSIGGILFDERGVSRLGNDACWILRKLIMHFFTADFSDGCVYIQSCRS